MECASRRESRRCGTQRDSDQDDIHREKESSYRNWPRNSTKHRWWNPESGSIRGDATTAQQTHLPRYEFLGPGVARGDERVHAVVWRGMRWWVPANSVAGSFINAAGYSIPEKRIICFSAAGEESLSRRVEVRAVRLGLLPYVRLLCHRPYPSSRNPDLDLVERRCPHGSCRPQSWRAQPGQLRSVYDMHRIFLSQLKTISSHDDGRRRSAQLRAAHEKSLRLCSFLYYTSKVRNE